MLSFLRRGGDPGLRRTRALASTFTGKKVLTVALVGRPNTGKSTLFNRLTRTRKAIVSSVPGTTRDRREGRGYLAGLPLQVIDTGGLDDRGEVSVHIQEQVEQSLRAADVILFLVDARAGLTALDNHFAKWMRIKIGQIEATEDKKIVVLANKSEGAHQSDAILDSMSEASRLGFGLPVPVSASHGDGLADIASMLVDTAEKKGYCLDEEEERASRDMHRRIAKRESQGGSIEEEGEGEAKSATGKGPLALEDKTIQLAFMGRPNVGKSTLMNAILSEERCITGPVAGLTRDAIEVEWSYSGRNFRLVDTAGLTRTRPVLSLTDSKAQKRSTDKHESLSLAAYAESDAATASTANSSSVARSLVGMKSSAGAAKKSPYKKITLPGIEFLKPDVDPSQFSYQVSEMALISALNALRFAQVVVLVVDSQQGNFSKTELQLARKCMEEGRGMVVVANKADLLSSDDPEQHVSRAHYEQAVVEHCEEYLREFGNIPVIVTSAANGQGVKRVLRNVIEVHDAWSKRCTTWVLNRWLRDTMVAAPSPRQGGKTLKVKYMTQIKARPPVFALFANVSELPGSVERYLKTRIQEDFVLRGIPVEFVVRKTSGHEVKKDLLKHKVGAHGKGRRGKGHGEGRGVGPKKRDLPIELRKLNDKTDIRRRRDSRQKKLMRK